MTEHQPKTIPEIEAKLSLRAAKKRYTLCEPIPAWPERAALILALLFFIYLVDAPFDVRLSRILVGGLFIGIMICLWMTINRLRQKVEELSRLATETESGASSQQEKQHLANALETDAT